MEEDNKKYEANFMFRDHEGRKELPGVFERLGVFVLEESPLLRIRLSYPIDKENLAFLGRFVISLRPESLPVLVKELGANNLFLRFLITKVLKKDLTETFSPLDGRAGAEGGEESIGEKSAVAREPDAGIDNRERDLRRPVREERFGAELSNEALEKKLEEILKE